MSIDHQSSNPYHSLMEEWLQIEQDQALERVNQRVDLKISDVIKSRPTHPDTFSNTMATYTAIKREIKLEELRMQTFAISLDADDACYIELKMTPQEDIDLPFQSEFTEDRNMFLQATQIGEFMGIEDFLESLVPADITDKDERIVYFSPWEPMELDERIGGLDVENDGSRSVLLLTDIPNIGVLYYYYQDSAVPERVICIYEPE